MNISRITPYSPSFGQITVKAASKAMNRACEQNGVPGLCKILNMARNESTNESFVIDEYPSGYAIYERYEKGGKEQWKFIQSHAGLARAYEHSQSLNAEKKAASFKTSSVALAKSHMRGEILQYCTNATPTIS